MSDRHTEFTEQTHSRLSVTRRDFLKLSALAGVGRLGLVPRLSVADVPTVRFGIITDLHYADAETRGSRFYRESLPKLRECVEQMNRQEVDFLIELGDFKDQASPPDEQTTLTYLNTVEAALQEFEGNTYHVLGNHDVDSISKEQFLSRVTNTDIPTTCKHYSFDVKDTHFIVLDANYRSDGMDYNHGNFDWTDANLPAAQLEWLQQDLIASAFPAIVFVHQLLDGEGSHYLKNAEQVRQVLEESGKVLAVFQGHQHAGQYHCLNSIHYYTLQAMVEGSGQENNAYAIVEVDGESGISIDGYAKVADEML